MRLKKLLITGIVLTVALRLVCLAEWDGELSAWFQAQTEVGRARTAAVFTTDAPQATEPLPTPEPSPAEEPQTESTDSPVLESGPSMTPEGVAIAATTIPGGLTMNNATSFSVDAAALLAEPLSLRLPTEGPQILIIHTHGSESYTPDVGDNYEASDPFRTQDKSHSVVAVGDALAAAWGAQGLRVLHDTEIYDYPSYNGSYTRSGAAVEAHLAENPGIAIVIDLHRDALGEDPIYKVVAEGEIPTSQLMLLVGTGENGLYHPNWKENLKLAVHLQAAVTQSFPTLARPLAVKQERYNQQLTTGSLILEVGTTGNTLSEAVAAAQAFGEATGPYLLSLLVS